MIQEVRRCRIRVHSSLQPGRGLLQRLHRVEVLFPDIGAFPVVHDLAFERYRPDQKITVFPSAAQVFAHLVGLTTP